MKVLFVTPVEIGSGETITALHMAEQIADSGGRVLFLSSTFSRLLIQKRFPKAIRELSNDGNHNRSVWDSTLREFRPNAIVFADYPLLFFSSGCSPMSNKEAWCSDLRDVDASLITLDHMGFAQKAMGLFFGPPHLSFHYEKLPAIPERMHIMLPCPMHEPSPLAWRKGHPFRYWNTPLAITDAQRRKVRLRFLKHEDDYLIFYGVAPWAWQSAQAHGLPHYQFLPQILDYYFADLPKPVTIISVNDGNLLRQPSHSKIKMVNLPSLPKSEFEALLFGSDLMITENMISITLGKAICGFLPCVALRNSYRYRELLGRLEGRLLKIVREIETMRPGAIYRYDIFPNGMKEELEQLGLYRENSITKGFKALEIYGEERTRQELFSLLTDESTRDAIRKRQRAYVTKLQKLGDSNEVLNQLVSS